MSLVHRASFALALSLCALGTGCSSELEEDDAASSDEALTQASVSPVELKLTNVNRASVRVSFEKRWGEAAKLEGTFTLAGPDGYAKTGTCSAPAIPSSWTHGTAYCSGYFDGSAKGTITFRYSGTGLTRLAMTSN